MKDQHSSWDIRLEHLRVGYGTRVVLDDINAVLPGGKITVILGESGCGKSTLLRMVAGLEQITSGELIIGERVVNNLEPKDRACAMVFQNYAL